MTHISKSGKYFLIITKVREDFSQYLGVSIVTMFSAIDAWVYIRSIEEHLGRGLFLLDSSYVNLATPFPVISLSIIFILSIYMFGRRFYWSKMAAWVMVVSPPKYSKKQAISSLKMLENCTAENFKKERQSIYNLFGPYRWIWLVFAVVLSITLLMLVGYDIPKVIRGVLSNIPM